MDEMPPVRYARSGDVNVAFQVVGDDRSADMVIVPGTMSHLAIGWPRLRTQFERYARFCRVIRFDKRGTGMSDRVTDAATLEERADDIRAVMDAAGSDDAVIFGASEGGSLACVFAATHPERTRSLIVWGCQARFVTAPDYPWGVPPAMNERRLKELERNWPSREYVRTWGAGLGDAPDEVVEATLSRMQMSATPAAVVALERMNGELDMRAVLPSIHVPSLVMAREGDPIIHPDAVRDLAARIPGAQLRLFPGVTHYMSAPWAGIAGDPVYDAIEEFVTGSPPAQVTDRVVATILVLDMVESTPLLAQIGDDAWRRRLDDHYRRVADELSRYSGTLVDTAGDGLLATFGGPARAIRCARAIMAHDRSLGLTTRAGVHVGEVERSGAQVRGLAVVVAARISALAQGDEVLVSSTAADIAAGSGIRFEDLGEHSLKGVPTSRRVFRCVPNPAS